MDPSVERHEPDRQRDVDAHHARAAAAGANVLVAPCDRPWGRDYEVEDDESYVFSFIA